MKNKENESLEEIYNQLDAIVLPKVEDGEIKFAIVRIIMKKLRELNSNLMYHLYNYLEDKDIQIKYFEENECYQKDLEIYLNNPAKMYRIEVEHTKMLTSREINELVKQRDAGDLTAVNKIVEANLRLVGAIAQSFLGKGLPYEDIIQEGNIGLIEAAKRYQSELGTFANYANHWVKGKICEAINEQARMIRIPTNTGKLSRKIKKFLAENQEIKYSISDLANYFNTSEESIERVLNIKNDPQLFSSLTTTNFKGDEKEFEYEDLTSTYFIEDIEEKMLIKFYLSKLKEREQQIIIKRYGLEDGQCCTQKEVGKIFGITRQGISIVEQKGLQRIKKIANKQ